MLAVGGGSTALHALGLGLLVVVMGASVWAGRDRPPPLVGALVAVGAVQGLLRLPLSSPTYASAAVAAVGTTPILVSAALRSRGAGRRIVVRCGLAAAGFLLVAAGIAGFIAVRAHSLLDDAERTARTGVDAAKAGDRASAANDFAQAEKAFRSASDITGGWWTWPARQVPLLAPQVRTIDQLVAIGKRTMTLATAGVKEVDPDRLRIENGRIDIATLDSYAPVFARLDGRHAKSPGRVATDPEHLAGRTTRRRAREVRPHRREGIRRRADRQRSRHARVAHPRRQRNAAIPRVVRHSRRVARVGRSHCELRRPRRTERHAETRDTRARP